MAAPRLKPRINFITLGVQDVSRSRVFYEKLGFVASSASNANVVFFDAKGIVLALYGHDALAEDALLKAGSPPEFRGMSLAWNGADETEVDAILNHAQSCGARLIKPAQKVFWGGYSGYFADHDGHLWEVAYNPYAPLDDDGRIQLPPADP